MVHSPKIILCLSVFSLLLFIIDASQASAGSQSSKVNVTASVLQKVKLQVHFQSPALTITREDIQKGYVDAPSATSLSIDTNSASGILLTFVNQGLPCKEVIVTGIRGPISITSGGGVIIIPDRKSAINLSYRFNLYENTEPGTYAWPLFISADPL